MVRVALLALFAAMGRLRWCSLFFRLLYRYPGLFFMKVLLHLID
jgi:hypothetical protein